MEKEVKDKIPDKKVLTIKKDKFKLAGFITFFRNFILSTQNTIGIDVGQGYIKIVQLQKSRGGYLLTDYRVRAIPYKVKDNIKDRNKFIGEFINEFIAQSRVRTSLGRLSIKGAGVFTFSFVLPPLSEKDLKGTVGIELKKRLPFQMDIKNLFFDYFTAEKFQDESSSIMVTCIAVDNSVLDKHLEFLKSFNIRPVVINIAQDAIGGLLGILAAGRYVGVLDMGVKQSCLSFYKGNLLQFTRDVPIGGEQLTHAILKVLSPLGENIIFEDAESFKRQCGIPMAEEAEVEFYTDSGAVKGGQLITALRPILERLITEVSRTITFYFRTYKIESLDDFYIVGGASRIKNMDKFLSANLSNLPLKNIERLNPLKAIKGWFDSGVVRHELMMEEAAPHLATAFGLCLDKGGVVNLIPSKEKLEQRALFLIFLAKLTLPLLLIGVGVVYSFTYVKIAWYQRMNKGADTQVEKYSPKVSEIEDYIALKNSVTEKESLLRRAIGRNPLLWGVLKELTLLTPNDVTLHSLEIAGGVETKKLVIKGEVVSEYTNINLYILNYTLKLEDSPFFENVELISSERDLYSPVPKAVFEIVCNLKA